MRKTQFQQHCLLIVLALAIYVQSSNNGITILKSDVLTLDLTQFNQEVSYDKSNLTQDILTANGDYQWDKSYTVITSHGETGSGTFPGNVGQISKALIIDDERGFVVSDAGLISLRIDNRKINKTKVIKTFNKNAQITIKSDYLVSYITSVNDDQIEVTEFDNEEFSYNGSITTWKNLSGMKPSINPQSLVFKEEVQRKTKFFYLVYQPYSTQISENINGFIWNEIGARNPNSGSLELNTENNFPVDTTAIFFMKMIDGKLWVAYNSSQGAGITSCELSVSSGDKIVIGGKAHCRSHEIQSEFKNQVKSIVIGSDFNGDEIFCWIYSSDDEFTQHKVTFAQIKDQKLYNYQSAEQYIYTYGAVFDRAEHRNVQRENKKEGLGLLFSQKEEGANNKKVTSMIYPISESDSKVIKLEMIHDPQGVAAYVGLTDGFMFTMENYSVYSGYNQFATIYGDKISEKHQVKSSLAQEPFSVQAVDDSTGLYRQKESALPDTKAYYNPVVNTISINRGFFQGNDLEFSIVEPNFKILNTYTWPDTATEELGDRTIILASNIGGVAVDSTSFQPFFCSGSMSIDTFKCKLSGEKRDFPKDAISVLVQETSPYTPDDKKIVFVTNENLNAGLYIFNDKNFYAKEVLEGHVATEANTHYQKINNMHTIWAVNTDKKEVTIYGYVEYDGKLDGKKMMVLNSDFLNRETLDFCPVSVQANSKFLNQVFIIAQCKEQQARIYTLKLQMKPDKFQKEILDISKIYDSKALISYQLGKGDYKLCALGEENIVQNKSGDKAISSTSTRTDASYGGLDLEKNLGTQSKELICIRGSENFLIVTESSLDGDQTYAAMYGNRSTDISSRYHSVKKLDGELSGFRVKDVTHNLEGYTIKLASDKKQKFQSVFLQGPKIYYTGPQIKDTEVTLTVKSKGKEVDSIKLKVNLETFKGDVVTKAKLEGKEIKKGTYYLDQVADITGPVFSMEIDKDTLPSVLTFNPLVVVDNDYTPMTDAALLPIGKIHEANYGMHLGYANDTKKVGVHVYIYKKVADYVDRFFLKDVRVKSYDRI